MIVTQRDARRIIEREYGQDFDFRLLAKSTQIGVRPMWQIELGKVMLCWLKIAPGKDSAVRIGRLLPSGDIDWSYEVQS